MKDKLNVIVNMSIEKIVGSSHVLTLLELYKLLYLNGGNPYTCEKSLREYHRKLVTDYKINMEKLEKTHVLKFKGRRYIPGIFKNGKLIAGHLHIHSDHLTDEKAKEYLEKGILKESDFHVLPGEKKKKVKFSKEQLIDIVQKDDYKELSETVRSLSLAKGVFSHEKAVSLLSDYIDNLK